MAAATFLWHGFDFEAAEEAKSIKYLRGLKPSTTKRINVPIKRYSTPNQHQRLNPDAEIPPRLASMSKLQAMPGHGGGERHG